MKESDQSKSVNMPMINPTYKKTITKSNSGKNTSGKNQKQKKEAKNEAKLAYQINANENHLAQFLICDW